MRNVLNVQGREINVNGIFPRIASVEGEKYLFLSDPLSLIEGLKSCSTRIDLFTFLQGLIDPTPKYDFPMTWDNFAALPITTFEQWWTQTLGRKGRNTARQAEKKGVTLREIPFNDSLVDGIWRINNECPVRQGKKFAHYGMSLERTRDTRARFSAAVFSSEPSWATR